MPPARPGSFAPVPLLRRTLLLAIVLFAAGCASVSSTVPASVSDRLFFGRAIPGGGLVSDAQWNAFVADTIVPRFPEGFSLWQGAGHWKGDDGVSVTEHTSVLEIVHPPDPAVDARLDEIARIYRQRFNQDAVMSIRMPVEQKFWRR
jgi:hypothetical protein